MCVDPIGLAIKDYVNGEKTPDLIVKSDLSEDDIMEVEYYFRDESSLPALEKTALEACEGRILDVGACVGAHAIPLQNKGHKVVAIDISKPAVDYLRIKTIEAYPSDFLSFKKGKFDTLLFLMNGIGIAESLEKLPSYLAHAKSLLQPGGKIICDSTDVQYFYEDSDGALWMDLNAAYYGEFKFQMSYKNQEGPWFNWLYLDEEKLNEYAQKAGFKMNILDRNPKKHSFLAELILQ